MNTQTAAVVTEEPEPWLPEDIRRIPPEFRDTELHRIAEKERNSPEHQQLTRELCEFWGIPYP